MRPTSPFATSASSLQWNYVCNEKDLDFHNYPPGQTLCYDDPPYTQSVAPTSVNVRGRLPDCTVQSKAGYDTEPTESKAEATLVVSLTLPDGLKHHKHYLARDSEALTLRASIEPRSRAVKVRPIPLGYVPGSPFAPEQSGNVPSITVRLLTTTCVDDYASGYALAVYFECRVLFPIQFVCCHALQSM